MKVNVTLEDSPKIKGWDFEKDFDFNNFIDSYFNTGIQATNLKAAIDIIKEMRKNNTKIFLGYTSNMVSSGIRESIKYLVKHRFVDVLVTTVGGIEEDFIKCFKPFVLGAFDVPGRFLLESGINRIGNIFVPNDRYVEFERRFIPVLEEAYKIQKERGYPITGEELIRIIGKNATEDSILFWALKNNISYFCPSLIDGALGDMIYFFKQRYPDFYIDITGDMKAIVDEVLDIKKERFGVIILGGGITKHHILNAMLFREGADYVVVINSGGDFDASDSGANLQEAISWGKINPSGKYVKVYAEASIVFPIIVEAAFKRN